MQTTLLLFLAACDGKTIQSARDTCDTYRACVADVSPDASADAESSYGEDSSCWGDGDAAAACGDECAGELGALHLAHPASAACDDGSPIPSNVVLADTSWIIATTGEEGQYCSTFSPPVDDIQFDFAPDDDTSFAGTLVNLGFFSMDLAGTCENDGVHVTCDFEHSEGTLVLDATLSDDLAEMTGTFDYAGNCTWTLDSAQ